MSWALNEDGSRRSGQPVTSHDLEERINMYISAMDKATSVNDESMSAQLQRDIQHLVDLMEKVSLGQPVMDIEVPPPLVMTPIHDAVANPLGELSSRLSDYHKALYFAEEELSENRLEKIQTLQKGLQTIHNLQKRAQAGFPITEDEIPAPVTIPDDSEFDNDALNTITNRLEEYKNALSFCEKSTGQDRRRIPKLQSTIRKLNFLLTRAQVKRPVWRKDIPPEFDYYCPEVATKSENIAKLTLQAKALQHRVSKCTNPRIQETKDSINQGLDKLIAKWTESKLVGPDDPKNLAIITAMLESIEKSEDGQTKSESTASSEQMKTAEAEEETRTDLELIDSRIKEYKSAALKAKRDGDVTQAIKDLKVVKGLQPMRDALEKGEKVDMTLVPPPPQDRTLAGELPPSFTSVADSTTKSTAEAAPQSAHAQVSPFNIRPATETAEDKLARKLTSFLEDEGEMKSFTSASSSSPSSFESDLSPVLRPEAGNEKTKTSEEVEKESTLDTESCSPLAPNVETSLACDSSVLSKPDSSHSEDNACNASQPGQILEENVGSPSTDLKEDTTGFATSLLTESGYEAKEKNSDCGASVIEREPVKSSQDDEERNESRNEIVHKGGESNFKETSNTNVEGTKGSPASPHKVSGSKNPLDKIGFLACQDVPLSEKEKQTANSIIGQNVDTGDRSNSNGAASEKDVTNNFTNECKDQSQSEEGSVSSLTSDLVSAKDAGVKDSMPCSVPSVISKGNDSVSNAPSSEQACSLPTNDTDPDRVESVTLTQDSQNQFSSFESSTISSMPYSVNNQIVNTQNDISHEKSIKNELPYMSIDQENDDHSISVAAKSNIANIYSLSGGSMNFDDAADMEEFQELMDSMSIVNDTSSLPAGAAMGLDEAASTKTAANQLNSALNNSTIPESDNVYQNANHSVMNVNSMTSDSAFANSSEITTVAHLHAQTTSTLNMPAGIERSLNQVSYQDTPSLQSIQLTGLETLKYDLLLAESKTSYRDKKEVEKLQEQMEKIKHHLRQGGREHWEEYKSCLEKELKALNDGVRDCGERQAWDTYKYLNNKRMLNERELCYLKQHIEEVKE